MAYMLEAEVEAALIGLFEELGYRHLPPAVAGPDGAAPERASYAETLLLGRLTAAIERLNPAIPAEARADALRKVQASEAPSLIEENRRLHRFLVEGVPVEFHAEDGTIRGDAVRLLDFGDIGADDWLVLDQFTVIEGGHERRADVVLFVNGLPLAVVEVKKPSVDEDLQSAFNQLRTYKAQVPSLFRTNAVLAISDGLEARLGSLTADMERFMPWRTVEGEAVAPRGHVEMEVLVQGVFERRRFLDLLRGFVVFTTMGGGAAKIVAGYHQYHAAKKAVARVLEAASVEGDRRGGVIWHTQGSGKSLLMVFLAGQLIGSEDLENPTLVLVTDRNDLDGQLFNTFAACRDLLRQTPVQAESRDDLRTALDRASGGVVFTTVQKFSLLAGEDRHPALTGRRNVVVIADEAHRSQYGFRARLDKASGRYAYGFARHLRDALPNATFVGFTGTPIEGDDKSTPAVFGEYVDIYDIARAVEDEATVPIYYESRLAKVELPVDQRALIDAEVEQLTEDEEAGAAERDKQRWAQMERVVGAERRLAVIAEDLVRHLEARLEALDGRAMAVCMSRRICVDLYDEIVALRPDWDSDDDALGAIKVVMTGAAGDPFAWQRHIGGKARREALAKRAKDPADPLKLVLVCDMWLTGFDAPPMHTLYVDKPMRGHGLMQAIARVNRVFRGKEAGLVVDYIGIAQNLRDALKDYSAGDQDQVGIDEAEAVEALKEKLDVVRAMFHGFDLTPAFGPDPKARLAILAGAIEHILAGQREAAARETDEEAKKRAHRRFQDNALALGKAFALAAASDEAAGCREEVAFYLAVRAALARPSARGGTPRAGRDLAVQQLIDRAVASTGIVDILRAAGFGAPDISILSEEFLAEAAGAPKKNLALEALRKLLNDEIASRSRTNVVETRRFSERLRDAINRYHGNALDTVQALQELIELAKEVAAARRRGEEQGLGEDELAFYDALAENESAVQVMGDDNLKVIAQELLNSLKQNAGVDWARREAVRARMRVLVKRILRKHGYPPDLEAAAVRTVLRQAEAFSARWAA